MSLIEEPHMASQISDLSSDGGSDHEFTVQPSSKSESALHAPAKKALRSVTPVRKMKRVTFSDVGLCDSVESASTLASEMEELEVSRQQGYGGRPERERDAGPGERDQFRTRGKPSPAATPTKQSRPVQARAPSPFVGRAAQPANSRVKDRSQMELASIMDQLQSGNVEARELAAERLFYLPAPDDSVYRAAVNYGIIEPLMQLLSEGNERGRMYAAYALSSLMTDAASMAAVRAGGGAPELVAMLRDPGMLGAKKGAMRALGRLARDHAAAAEIVRAGGLGPIIELLECNDVALVRRCLVALYSIGAEKEHLQTEILTAGAVPPTIKLCRSGQAELQAEAMEVMKMLSRHPVAGGFIVGAGGLGVLAEAAEKAQLLRTRVSAIKAIQRLASIPGIDTAVRNSEAGEFLHIDSNALNATPAAPTPVSILKVGGQGSAASKGQQPPAQQQQQQQQAPSTPSSKAQQQWLDDELDENILGPKEVLPAPRSGTFFRQAGAAGGTPFPRERQGQAQSALGPTKRYEFESDVEDEPEEEEEEIEIQPEPVAITNRRVASTRTSGTVHGLSLPGPSALRTSSRIGNPSGSGGAGSTVARVGPAVMQQQQRDMQPETPRSARYSDIQPMPLSPHHRTADVRLVGPGPQTQLEAQSLQQVRAVLLDSPGQMLATPEDLAAARHLTWKFFRNYQGYTLVVTMLKSANAWEFSARLNDCLLYRCALSSMKWQTTHSFRVVDPQAEDIAGSTFTLQVQRRKDKLEGSLRLDGVPIQNEPEFSMGDGVEEMDRVNWELPYGGMLYVVTVTISNWRYKLKVYVNGFPVAEKKYTTYQAMKWSRDTIEFQIMEPGLGKLYGARLRINVGTSGFTGLGGTLQIGNEVFKKFVYSRENGPTVLPLIPPMPDPSQQQQLSG